MGSVLGWGEEEEEVEERGKRVLRIETRLALQDIFLKNLFPPSLFAQDDAVTKVANKSSI